MTNHYLYIHHHLLQNDLFFMFISITNVKNIKQQVITNNVNNYQKHHIETNNVGQTALRQMTVIVMRSREFHPTVLAKQTTSKIVI